MTDNPDFVGRLQKGLSLPSDKKIYFNGFALNITPADIAISLENGGETVALIVASHSTAKSLVEILGAVIKTFEKDTGQRIRTLKQLEEKVVQAQDAKPK
jgi:hypothetical protein